MEFTLALGWWLAPLLVTAASFSFAWISSRGRQSYGADIAGMFAIFVAAIVSLVAWLVYALIF